MRKSDKSTALPLENVLGHFESLQPGVKIVVTENNAYDYCSMRACQLSALLSIISGAGHDNFADYNDATQDNVKWLARTLAHEIENLLPLVRSEAMADRKVSDEPSK